MNNHVQDHVQNHVEVKLTLDREHAAKLADVAGGEANIHEAAAAILQNALTQGGVDEEANQPSDSDPLLRIDLYG